MAFVVDTSAIVGFLLDEPGSDQVQAIMEGDEEVALPFMVLMETRYVLMRQLSSSHVERLIEILRAAPIEVIESDPEWGRRAAEVKARGGLSLADAWIAALALQRDAVLVHKDPEFDKVEGLQALTLPNA